MYSILSSAPLVPFALLFSPSGEKETGLLRFAYLSSLVSQGKLPNFSVGSTLEKSSREVSGDSTFQAGIIAAPPERVLSDKKRSDLGESKSSREEPGKNTSPQGEGKSPSSQESPSLFSWPEEMTRGLPYEQWQKYFGFRKGVNLLDKNKTNSINYLVREENIRKGYGWENPRDRVNSSSDSYLATQFKSFPGIEQVDHNWSLSIQDNSEGKREKSILDAWETLFETDPSSTSPSWFETATKKWKLPFLDPAYSRFILVSFPKGYIGRDENRDFKWPSVSFRQFTKRLNYKKSPNWLEILGFMGVPPNQENEEYFIVESPKELLREWLSEWDSSKRKSFPNEEYYLFTEDTTVLDEKRGIILNTLTRQHNSLPYKLWIVSKAFSNNMNIFQYHGGSSSYLNTLANIAFYTNNSSFLWEIYKYYLVSWAWKGTNWVSLFNSKEIRKNLTKYDPNSGKLMGRVWSDWFNTSRIYTEVDKATVSLYNLPMLLEQARIGNFGYRGK